MMTAAKLLPLGTSMYVPNWTAPTSGTGRPPFCISLRDSVLWKCALDSNFKIDS